MRSRHWLTSYVSLGAKQTARLKTEPNQGSKLKTEPNLRPLRSSRNLSRTFAYIGLHIVLQALLFLAASSTRSGSARRGPFSEGSRQSVGLKWRCCNQGSLLHKASPSSLLAFLSDSRLQLPLVSSMCSICSPTLLAFWLDGAALSKGWCMNCPTSARPMTQRCPFESHHLPASSVLPGDSNYCWPTSPSAGSAPLAGE